MRFLHRKKNEQQPGRRRAVSEHLSERRQAEQQGQAIFRRNRTLVGSLSPQVSSASELTGDLRSPRAHVHHLTAHRRMLGTIFIVVIGAACFLIWLLYEFTAGIYVAPVGGVVVPNNRYDVVINQYLTAHPLERFRVLLNESALTDYVAQIAPEVESVHSDGSAGFAASQFAMTFREPVVGWLIGSNHYYVDDNGVSFQVNYFDQPVVKIVDKSGVPQTAGTTVASSRFLRFVGQTVTLAKKAGLTVTQATIPAGTTHAIEVNVAGHSYPVKLSLDRPVGEQVEDMQHALMYFDTHNENPQYIDIRVSGKAYYK